jgi:hypothetical protein
MLPPYDPCTAFYSSKCLNIPEVQKAMHANVSGIIEYPWCLCKLVARVVLIVHVSLHFPLQ